MSALKASIIIRTKNEERWIDKCIEAIAAQEHRNFEIVLVDNESSDATVKKAERHGIRAITISAFRPGQALNQGIRASSGDAIVCLSAHCIPAGPKWLGNLLMPLSEPGVAGTYGRQEPLPFSDAHDKRDLLTVFGLDRKVQERDPFFHNANSAILRSTWEKFPFDEEVRNLEDRVWGQAVIDAGLKIVYEPSASVYHWHGIHQGLDPQRARGVVRVMEQIHGETTLPEFLAPDRHHNVVVIPVREQPDFALQSELLRTAVRQALLVRSASRVIVSTESSRLAEVARSAGAETPFVRPVELAQKSVDVIDVLRHAMAEVERGGPVTDAVVLLEVAYPMRRVADVSAMLDRLYAEGLEVVVAGRRERRGLWLDQQGNVEQVGEGFGPRDQKTSSAYVGLLGYGTVFRSAALRGQSPFDDKVGVYEVDDDVAALEFRPGLREPVARRLLDTLTDEVG